MPADARRPEARRSRSPATQFFLRGLAISLPPILTLVILLWIARGINDYIIHPINLGVRLGVAQFIQNSRPTKDLVSWDRLPPLDYCDRNYRVTRELRRELEARWKDPEADVSQFSRLTGQIPLAWVMQEIDGVYVPFGSQSVPYADYHEVAERVWPGQMPTSPTGIYMELVSTRSSSVMPLGVIAFVIVIVLLYFLGRFVTARLGVWVVHKFETGVLGRLPIISNVYSSVKQVTDFFFTERTLEYNRVVAVEYPRRGLWSLGFVTSDSMLEMTAAAGEPLVSVLMPTSPMPMTGFTINVPRSEVLDLNITVDQAFQYCLSCGVLVPPQQRVTPELLQQELTKRFADAATSAVRRGNPRNPGGHRNLEMSGDLATGNAAEEVSPPAEPGRQETEDSQ